MDKRGGERNKLELSKCLWQVLSKRLLKKVWESWDESEGFVCAKGTNGENPLDPGKDELKTELMGCSRMTYSSSAEFSKFSEVILCMYLYASITDFLRTSWKKLKLSDFKHEP